MKNKTMKGLRLCALWLAFCLEIGWRKDDLDFLEALWWKYRNGNGELIRGTE